MINKIKIKNYKGIKKLEISDLKTFNIISGKNSSGKTTVLEAIFMYLARYNPDSISRLLSWRNAASMVADIDMNYKHIFNELDITKDIIINLYEDTKSRSLTIKYNANGEIPMVIGSNQNSNMLNMNTGSNNSFTGEVLELISDETGKRTVKCKLNISQNGAMIYSETNNQENKLGAFISTINRGVMQEAAESFSRLVINKTGKKESFVKYAQIIEPNIADIQSASNNGVQSLYIDLGYQKYLPIELLGDGINRFMYLALRIMDLKNGILLVDEIENGFHYSIVDHVVDALINIAKENKCQIIATTHNYDFIHAIVSNTIDSYKEDISYYRISKEDSCHEVQHLNYDKLKRTIMNDLEVR